MNTPLPQFQRTWPAALRQERFQGLYDRGALDAYFDRPANPHWVDATYVTRRPLNECEVAEYMAGYTSTILE
jgi:hypothetical protein